MLARLTEILNVKNKGKGPEMSKGLQEDHFTLGDSGEE